MAILMSLGRVVQHDERSRAFPAPTAGATGHVNHKRRGILDQGSLGSCTGNALVGCLNTEPLHTTGQKLYKEATAVQVYSRATAIDGFPGVYPPQDTGSSGLAACKAAQGMGLITSYTHAFGVEHMLAALMLGPVMVGTDWFESMFNPGHKGLVGLSGNVVGGHEYEIKGWLPKPRHFVAVNSWGRSWGQNGRFRISYDDMNTLLARSGDVTVPQRAS